MSRHHIMAFLVLTLIFIGVIFLDSYANLSALL